MSVLSSIGQSLIVDSIKAFLPGIIDNQDTAQAVLSLANASSKGVIFTLNDLPQEISQGSEQVLAVHKYVGGGIDIQTLGAFKDPVSWSATFTYNDNSGNTALKRAQTLNAMNIQGDTCTLIIGTMHQNVIIHKFTYKYVNDYYVPYEIELLPIEQMSGQSSTSSTTATSSSSTTTTATSGATTTITVAAAETTLGDILGLKGTTNSSLANTAVTGNNLSQTLYRVVEGDTLFSIAKAVYGDSSLWTTIATANSIQNALSIKAGQQITIPNKTTS